MSAFAVLGLVVSAVINLAGVAWLTVVALQVRALRRGKMHKDDGDVIGSARLIYERYFEPEDS